MEIGMAHSGPRHPDDYVRRILQTWSLDVHELERFVVGEKSGRLHAPSYRAQSIWVLWSCGTRITSKRSLRVSFRCTTIFVTPRVGNCRYERYSDHAT